MAIILGIAAVAVIIFLLLVYFRVGLPSKNRKIKEGIRLENEGKYHEALSSYDFALSKGYSTPELRWKIANVALKINLIPRAQKELNILLGTHQLPNNITLTAVKALMANTYIKQGQEREAFVQLLELYNIDQNNPEVLFQLAKIYSGQRLTKKAIPLFEKYINQYPSSGEAYYYLGRAQLDAGETVQAIPNLERAVRFREYDGGKVYFYLGVLYFSQKKYKIALQQFNKVMKHQPSRKVMADTHRLIALAYRNLGLVDEAIVSFAESEKISNTLPKESRNKEALYNQGVLLYKKGKLQEALEKFQRLKMLDSQYKDVDKIVSSLISRVKGLPGGEPYVGEFITENPIFNITKKGLLYSPMRFDITRIEKEVQNNALFEKKKGGDVQQTKQQSTVSHMDVDRFNMMNSKVFKDVSRKLVQLLGFQIKSEPRFMGDSEYIDGNAINFNVAPINNPKARQDLLITVRRFSDPVSELAVSRFLDWMEEEGYEKGVFIASNAFSPQALKLSQVYKGIKLIDRGGLGRMLGRIK
jgi:tetratricopeptide (TPR) repeat protein